MSSQSRCPSGQVRVNRAEHRSGRTRPAHRRVQRLVQPADGDCHQYCQSSHAQLPEEASFRGWAQPKLQSTRTLFAATVLMAIGVTIWHIPFLLMPQFGSSPIEATATVAVTFWYAWLFNHASGSSLLTLIAHATEGTIETSTLWQSGADTTRMTWLYCLVWCLVAIGLLVFDRRLWTKPPGPVDDLNRVDARVESKM